ncbi:hypothetical protein E2C01_002149 [Portunus trituberculatus]|uniref:Uncharacterized protein n=1 Tax=Portunus trituberculatus TaxID=210409 RepID=A0A5B7CJT4_PORTR|nr:hypothetical protein [Portunus trituberculatus]
MTIYPLLTPRASKLSYVAIKYTYHSLSPAVLPCSTVVHCGPLASIQQRHVTPPHEKTPVT